MQVTQNNETTASEKTGRTGGLPYEGVGWYRTTFDADTAGTTTLVFDGAMSEARVYLNGEEICFLALRLQFFLLRRYALPARQWKGKPTGCEA